MMVAIILIASVSSYGQSYVSKKQHINTVNGQYIETNDNMYIKIENERILITDRKGLKVYEEFKLGETKKGDVIVRYSFNQSSEGSTGKPEIIRRSLDSFTNKSSKIIYELTLLN